MALAEDYTSEQIRAWTGHRTSKAFERYFRLGDGLKQELYATARGGKKLAEVIRHPAAGKS